MFIFNNRFCKSNKTPLLLFFYSHDKMSIYVVIVFCYSACSVTGELVKIKIVELLKKKKKKEKKGDLSEQLLCLA